MKKIQEENVKLYPLTESQDTMFLNLKWSFGHEEIVNICATMHFEKEMDPNLLLQATSLAMLRNQAASIRIRKVGKKMMQYFSNQAPDPIIVMDYSDETQEKYDEDILKFSSTPFPNKSLDTQLYSIRLIKKPDGFYALYFCVSHIIFDAYSLIATANEILTMYECLRDGLPIPENKCDTRALLEKEQAYIDSPAMQKDMDYFDKEVYATEPLFSNICGDPRVVKKGQTLRYGNTLKLGKVKAGVKQYRLKADLVNKLIALAAENKISPFAYYYLAIRSYLSKVNNLQEDITFQNNIARRGTLAEKRAFGVRVVATKMRLNIPNSTPFAEALLTANEVAYKALAHSNLGTNRIIDIYEKKFGVPPMHGYDSFNFTFNPVFPAEHKDLPFHFTLHSNGSFAMQAYLTIMPFDNSGDLVFNYDYQFATTKPDTIDKLHAHITKALETMSENKINTVGDLAKL